MDPVRYFIAALVIISFPAVLPVWFLIHPLVAFWRKIGPVRTWAMLMPLILGIAAAMVWMLDGLLAVDFGTNYALMGVAILFYAVAAAIEIQSRRQLNLKMLVGYPELAPDKGEPKLLTEGIYSRVRHPRYLDILLGLTAVALFTNYLAIYVLLAAIIPLGYVMIVLEERELRDRFGEEYAEYSRRVPRFIPSRRDA